MTEKVYFLDDEEQLCLVFQEYMEAFGINTKVFINPDEAITSANNEPPLMMFIDYRLPGTTGDKVALSIPSHIRKILVTGELNVEVGDEFEMVIKKPYKLAQLKELVDQLG